MSCTDDSQPRAPHTNCKTRQIFWKIFPLSTLPPHHHSNFRERLEIRQIFTPESIAHSNAAFGNTATDKMWSPGGAPPGGEGVGTIKTTFCCQKRFVLRLNIWPMPLASSQRRSFRALLIPPRSPFEIRARTPQRVSNAHFCSLRLLHISFY